MPSFPPRTEAFKKQEQLNKREQELQQAIQNNFSTIRLNKAIENYRLAKLSLLKAKAHIILEKELQKCPHTLKMETIESEIETWKNKTDGEIISNFKIIK